MLYPPALQSRFEDCKGCMMICVKKKIKVLSTCFNLLSNILLSKIQKTEERTKLSNKTNKKTWAQSGLIFLLDRYNFCTTNLQAKLTRAKLCSFRMSCC